MIPQTLLDEIQDEYNSASAKFPPYHSTHEGYAVIKEEVDELWDLVKSNKGLYANADMKKECVQIAAMTIRFIADLSA